MNKTKYMQTDSRWSKLPFRNLPDNIGNNGCGEVSICNMIIEMEKYAKYTPATIQPYCKQWATPDGYVWSGVIPSMKNYGLTEVKECATMEPLWKELAKGNRVAFLIMGSRPGGSKGVHWSSSGHCIAVTGYKYESGLHKVYVKDSYSNASNRNGWISYEENLRGDVLKVYVGKLTGKLTDGTVASEVKGTTKTSSTIKTSNLTVDGIGGEATVKRMQQFFGTVQDGVISGQNKNYAQLYPALKAVSYGRGGSSCIKALQKWLGLSGPDGIIGKNTTGAWQKKLRSLGYLAANETIDGIFGVKSMKAWQECLNNNGKKKGGTTPAPKPTPTNKKYKVIDVSEWQGSIDWKKVKSDGVVGAIIRYADGDYLDPVFDKNMKNAKAAGLHIGAYIFSRAKTKAGAEKEATRLYNACKAYKCDMPLYIDLEAKGLEKYANTVANAFIAKMKALGGYPGVYANLNWWNNYLTKTTAPAVWVAQYYTKCEYKGSYGMWQYSSSGSVKGISGKVDMDWCYADYWNKIKTTAIKKTYGGSYPTMAEIKSASNAGTRNRICAWCKKIADSGQYKYKKYTDDVKTHQCPICHKLTGKYKGWNCIGFAFASWHHGGGLKSKCSCDVLNNSDYEKMLTMTDANINSYVKKKVGINELKVIRNKGKEIPVSMLKAGDIIVFYNSKNTYLHTAVYVGDGKYADDTSGRTPNIKYGSEYSKSGMICKIAIEYTGSNDYLKKGDRGSAVKKIKDYLVWWNPKYKFDANNIFGAGTENAVKAFQKENKLTVDGQVGQKTIDAMKAVRK